MKKLGKTKGETKRILSCRCAHCKIENIESEYFGARKVKARKN